jgi:predicted small metal-binding protein
LGPRSVYFKPQLADLEAIMTRKYIDCREIPSKSNCSVTISADSEQELMDVAVQHAVAQHGHQDTPQLRQQLAGAVKTGAPPA